MSVWVVLDRTCCGEHGDILAIFSGDKAEERAHLYAGTAPTSHSRTGRRHPVTVEEFELWDTTAPGD